MKDGMLMGTSFLSSVFVLISVTLDMMVKTAGVRVAYS